MTAFNEKPYGRFEDFIEAIRLWIHEDGQRSAQLCGCETGHSYRSPWTSFKLGHFADSRWNGPYVLHADTKRQALLRLLELVDAGQGAEEIFVPDNTARGSRTVRVQGTTAAAGLYIYQSKFGVPYGETTRKCRGDAPRR